MKMNCILGVLDNDRGRDIAEEMTEWLSKEYIITPVVHNGLLYEYPALKTAIETSINTEEPVLYLHTKGAANINPALTKQDEYKYMCKECNPPEDVTILDWQSCVRKMWRYEFIDNIGWYKDNIYTDEPIILAPYTSPQKHTWTNGMMFNSEAAKRLYPLKYNSNRWSYEKLFSNTDVTCVARVYDNMIGYPQMYKWKRDVWSHWRDY